MSERKKFTIRRIFEAIGEAPIPKALNAFVKDEKGYGYERNGLPVNVPIGSACAMGNAAIALRVSPTDLYEVLNGNMVSEEDYADYNDLERLRDHNIGDAIAEKNDQTTKSLPVLSNFFRRHFLDVLDVEVFLTTYEDEITLKKLEDGTSMLVADGDPWFMDNQGNEEYEREPEELYNPEYGY